MCKRCENPRNKPSHSTSRRMPAPDRPMRPRSKHRRPRPWLILTKRLSPRFWVRNPTPPKWEVSGHYATERGRDDALEAMRRNLYYQRHYLMKPGHAA